MEPAASSLSGIATGLIGKIKYFKDTFLIKTRRCRKE